MPMPPYRIICSEPGCPRDAVYKIAARWSDGTTGELKTYGLVCEQCLPAGFTRAAERQAGCRRAANESLDSIAIFRLQPHARDEELQRVSDLEAQIQS